MDNNEKKVYMQFYADLKIPIYIEISQDMITPAIQMLFARSHFSNIDEGKVKEAIEKNNLARILKFEKIGAKLKNRFFKGNQTHQFGAESVNKYNGHRIYKFQGIGVIVYSPIAKEWRCGILPQFGDDKYAIETNIFLNRFLSFALVQSGFFGIWGVPVEEGIVVQSKVEGQGEAVFINLLDEIVLTVDGHKKIRPNDVFIRLDQTLKGRSVGMKQEELLSFLYQHCTYIDTDGPSVPIRQMLQYAAKYSVGQIFPYENFRPRTELTA